jgi:hypothetical protein
MDVQFPFSIVMRDDKPYVHLMSIGPDDESHPGLPEVQSNRLKHALAAGIRLMRGAAWLGLPCPVEIRDPTLFVQTNDHDREQRQIDASARIEARGVGKAAFDVAGGWNAQPGASFNEKMFAKACAEWADGELVASHIAYQHDILCTNDQARAAGASIFDSANRAWLTAQFGVRFVTLDELLKFLKRVVCPPLFFVVARCYLKPRCRSVSRRLRSLIEDAHVTGVGEQSATASPGHLAYNAELLQIGDGLHHRRMGHL